jgi:hypothetical protein
MLVRKMTGALLRKPSMQSHKRLTSTKLPLAIATVLALCGTAFADDPVKEMPQRPLTDADLQLLSALDAGYAYAKKAVPLADQEFKVLESHVKTPDPGHIVFWMYQPVMKALDEPHHDTASLRHYLSLKVYNESSRLVQIDMAVSQTNGLLYHLASLGSLMLAEAVGGSPQQSQLVERFIESQRITLELQSALNGWMSSRGADASTSPDSPEPSPSASPNIGQ